MAYTPINWATGDTITADKLNRCDNGWAVESTQLFSETVTTAVDPEYPDDPPAAHLAYTSQITASTIIVTFDSTDYTCDNQGGAYGGAGYPFKIMSIPGFGNILETDVAGTFEISAATSSIEVSSSFRSAVNSFVDTSTLPMRCISGTTTAQAAYQAMSSGRMLFFNPYNDQYQMCFVTGLAQDGTVSFVPTLSGVTASVQGGLFVVSYN